MLADHLSDIPADSKAAVYNALQQIFPIADITGISLLSGGLSGSLVYKIVAGEHAYTLKLNLSAKSIDVMSGAATAGIAPTLYYGDPEKGIFITGFIDNKPIRNVFDPGQLAAKLAEKIRTIHALPSKTVAADVFSTIDDLISQFGSAGRLQGAVFEACFEYYARVKESYPRSSADQVFSHNDLNPNNILCDGAQIWIVDWDVAAVNNRYVDLANAANYFVHTSENERIFLQTYFGQIPDDHQLACFHVMRPLCRVLYSLMMFQLAFAGKPADFRHDQKMDGIDMPAFGALMGAGKLSLSEYDGQLMYGKALMNTALAQMRAPYFSQYLALLTA